MFKISTRSDMWAEIYNRHIIGNWDSIVSEQVKKVFRNESDIYVKNRCWADMIENYFGGEVKAIASDEGPGYDFVIFKSEEAAVAWLCGNG